MEIIKVATVIIAISNSNPSHKLVNSAIEEETTEVPKPNPVADVAMTPSKNNRSTVRPGHLLALDLRIGSQAALNRNVGFFFIWKEHPKAIAGKQ